MNIHQAMQRTRIYLTVTEQQGLQRMAALGLWADHPAPPDLDELRREERFPAWGLEHAGR
jgi:hypothetical protein